MPLCYSASPYCGIIHFRQLTVHYTCHLPQIDEVYFRMIVLQATCYCSWRTIPQSKLKMLCYTQKIRGFHWVGRNGPYFCQIKFSDCLKQNSRAICFDEEAKSFCVETNAMCNILLTQSERKPQKLKCRCLHIPLRIALPLPGFGVPFWRGLYHKRL